LRTQTFLLVGSSCNLSLAVLFSDTVDVLLQSCQLLQCQDTRLVCNGYYPEIHVMHPRRLEILFSLCAQIQPDWISALCILRPVNREGNLFNLQAVSL